MSERRRPLKKPSVRERGRLESDNRRTPRIQPFVAPCIVRDGKRRLTGYLRDLSATGAGVSCDQPLTSGAEALTLEVRFSRRPAATHLPARVHWAQVGSKPGEAAVFGVAFDGANPEDLQVVGAVLQEFQSCAAMLS